MKVAVSGPSASGKGTISRRVATNLGLYYVDAGLVFRAIACTWHDLYAATSRDPSPSDISHIADSLEYAWTQDVASVRVHGQDITHRLAIDSVARYTAKVSSSAAALKALCGVVDSIASPFARSICDGRNAGTLFLADAEVRLFITASLDVRARRRFNDLTRLGLDISLEDIRQSLQVRDRMDEQRAVGSLTFEDGTWQVVDTSQETLDESVQRVQLLIGSSISTDIET